MFTLPNDNGYLLGEQDVENAEWNPNLTPQWNRFSGKNGLIIRYVILFVMRGCSLGIGKFCLTNLCLMELRQRWERKVWEPPCRCYGTPPHAYGQVDNGLFHLRQSPPLAPLVVMTRSPVLKEYMCIQIFMSVSAAVTLETRVVATEGLPGPRRLAGERPCPAPSLAGSVRMPPLSAHLLWQTPQNHHCDRCSCKGRPRLSLT